MEKDYEVDYEENSEQNLYTDGEDKKPKILLIIIGIIVLLIIILIFFFACSNGGSESSNNYLSNINVSNGQLTPIFKKDTLVYSVSVTDDYTTINCSSESYKATTSGCNKRIYLTEECVEHNIKVIAESNAVREYKLNICKQSKNAPVIKEVKTTPEGYTKEKVTVVVEATFINESNEKAYSFDGGVTWQSSNSFTVTENKTLQIKVRDKNNNESAIFTKEIKTIDNTKPSVSVKGSTPSGTSTTSDVTLTAIVSPDTTPSGYEYQWYKGTTAIKGATKNVYTATSSGEYKVKITTGSGNSVTSNVFKVNKKASPASNKLSIDKVEGNATSWTNKNVTLKVTKVTSTNGLAAKPYSFDGGKTWQKENNKAFSTNQTVNIVVKDKNGKTASRTEYITKIDKITPKVSITGGDKVGSILTAKVTPATAPSKYTSYQWYFNNEPIKSGTSSTYAATKAGKYEVKVTTGSGNTAKSNVFTVKANIEPHVSLTSSEEQGKWTNKNVTLTAKVTNGTAKSYSWYAGNNFIKTTTTNTFTISSEVNQTYKVIVKFTDNVEKTSGTVGVKIDKTAPTIRIDARLDSYSGTSYTSGNWTNKNIYINVSSSDNQELSNLQFQYLPDDTIWYGHATKAWTSKTISGKSGTASIMFGDNRNHPFTVKATDAAGNETIQKIDTRIDKTAPTITIDARLDSYSGTSYTPGNCTNKSIYINVSSTDNQELSDLQFQYLPGDTIWYGHATKAWASKTISGKTGKATIKFDDNRNHPFTVKAIDVAGNETIQKIDTRIDKTAPTCT